MEKRNLGSIGTKVGALGIGAMSFSDFYGPTNTQESHAILKMALDNGIDHIDTAKVYGMGLSEERIGQFLDTLSQSDRQFFKIATKGGIDRKNFDDKGTVVFDNSKEFLTLELNNSLKRLGLDCVELYYVHRREADRPIEEVTETLVEFIKAGKIKQFGFSEIAPTSLEKAATIHPVGAVQSEYSLSTRYPELGLVQKTKSLGTSLVAFSPIGRSLLTDKPHNAETVEKMEFLKANPRFIEPNLSNNIQATQKFREYAADLGCKASGLAIAWLLKVDKHVLPIPGTRSVTHLKEMIDGCALNLTDSNMRDIENILPVGWAHGDRYSTGQWFGPEKYC
jgi:aryl-alcohol dehydrogenase-like predicted oxidoreductase